MNKTMMRTCGCGDVTEIYEGQQIKLCGWTQRSRNLGALQFIALRDRSGIVQVVIDEEILCSGIQAKSSTRLTALNAAIIATPCALITL